jgi:rhodanese-related sulfurtransferase
MQQLAQFISNHWELWLALLGILVLIFINEIMAQKKRGKTLSPAAAIDMINRENAVVIDLREQDAFRAAHIIDSVRASADDFSQKRMEKYQQKPFILVCARGLQSAALASKLKAQGFIEPMVLAGGIAAWQEAGLPLVKKKG